MKKPGKVHETFSILITRDIHARLKKVAATDEQSKAAIVRRYIRAGLKKDGYIE